MKDVTDVGTWVACDSCGKDWSFRNESGGFLFCSHAVCPDCAPEYLKGVKKYKEEHFIKAYCPPNMSFWMWVLELRGGNNTITILTGEDLPPDFPV